MTPPDYVWMVQLDIESDHRYVGCASRVFYVIIESLHQKDYYLHCIFLTTGLFYINTVPRTEAMYYILLNNVLFGLLPFLDYNCMCFTIQHFIVTLDTNALFKYYILTLRAICSIAKCKSVYLLMALDQSDCWIYKLKSLQVIRAFSKTVGKR